MYSCNNSTKLFLEIVTWNFIYLKDLKLKINNEWKTKIQLKSVHLICWVHMVYGIQKNQLDLRINEFLYGFEKFGKQIKRQSKELPISCMLFGGIASQHIGCLACPSACLECSVTIKAQKMSSATLRLFSLAEQCHTQNFISGDLSRILIM